MNYGLCYIALVIKSLDFNTPLQSLQTPTADNDTHVWLLTLKMHTFKELFRSESDCLTQCGTQTRLRVTITCSDGLMNGRQLFV